MDNPTNQMPPAIATALVKAQKASHAVEKAKTMEGKSFSYNFAGAEAVVAESRRALAEADLAVCVAGWAPIVLDGQPRLEVRFLLTHADGSSWKSDPASFPAIANAGRPPDKAEASALTYVTNYFITRLLNLPRVDAEDVGARDDSGYQPDSKQAPHRATPVEPNGTHHIMRFGKHKDRDFADVLRENSKYADWYRGAIAKSVNDPTKAQYRDRNQEDLATIDAIMGASIEPQPPEEDPFFDAQDEIPF